MASKFLLRVAASMILLAGIVVIPLAQNSRQRSVGQSKTQPDPQDSGDTIKIETTLVTIPVSILDRNGKYIPDLKKGDFRLFEDNVEQEITYFTSVETPFNVVLLLDTSRSTIFKMEDIQQAALAFIDQLHPDDRVMVVSFDSEIYIDSEFTTDRRQLRRAIYDTRTGGSTRLYDAVDLTITERLQRIEGRKAVVLFTDGVDTDSRLASAESTLEQIEESGVLVYPIQYDTEVQMRRGYDVIPPIFWPFPRDPRNGRGWPFDPQGGRRSRRGRDQEDYARAGQYLRDLAENSGARLYHADTVGNLRRAFSQIAEELRHQYSLGYYPTNTVHDGTYRRIRVHTGRPNLVVRARGGYRAPDGESQ